MSEILHGVLNMPPELWCNDEVSILQRHSCYLEASRLIKELEQRLAEAEELKADFKKAMRLFEDTGLDNLLWELLDTITKGE